VKDLKSLLLYIFNLFKRIEDAKAMAEDKRLYELSLKDIPEVKCKQEFSYGLDNLSWCFVNRDMTQSSRISNCRDYFNESLQASIKNTHHAYRPVGEYEKIDTDKFRFVLINVDARRLQNALEILDIYAKAAGWHTAKMIRVRFARFNGFVIEADRNWLRYPQLMSIFILIIRFIQFEKKKVIRKPWYAKTVCDLDLFWKELIEEKANALGGYHRLPGNYPQIYKTYKYLIPIFMHEKEIFSKAMPKSWTGEKMDANSGIHTFTNGACTKDHMLEAETLKNFYEVEVLENEQKADKMYNRNGS